MISVKEKKIEFSTSEMKKFFKEIKIVKTSKYHHHHIYVVNVYI